MADFMNGWAKFQNFGGTQVYAPRTYELPQFYTLTESGYELGDREEPSKEIVLNRYPLTQIIEESIQDAPTLHLLESNDVTKPG